MDADKQRGTGNSETVDYIGKTVVKGSDLSAPAAKPVIKLSGMYLGKGFMEGFVVA